MIKINEELAIKIGYKNLRGLKMGISRRFGKGTYSKDLQVSKEVIIFLASRKNKYEVAKSYIDELSYTEEQLDVYDLTIVDSPRTDIVSLTSELDRVYDVAVNRIEEIKIRQGEFYNDGYSILDVSDISSLLISMHLNNEITQEQMNQIAFKNKLDIPITFTNDKDKLDAYYQELDKLSNSYRRFNTNVNSSDSFSYGVVEQDDLSYANVIEHRYEQDDDVRQENISNMECLTVEKGNIAISVGYDTSGEEWICVYNEKQIIAHYRCNLKTCEDWDIFHSAICKVLDFDNIDKQYISLADSFISKCKIYNTNLKKQELDNQREQAIVELVDGDYTYLLFKKPYVNKGDMIKIYENYNEVFSDTLESATIQDTEFEEQLKQVEGFGLFETHDSFRQKLIQEHRRILDEVRQRERKAREEQYESYSGYSGYSGNSGLFNLSTNDNGNKLINGIAVLDENKKKNIYKVLSKSFHPDLEGGSVEMMQIVNELKVDWAI